MIASPDMRIPVFSTPCAGSDAAGGAYLAEGDLPVPAGAYAVRFTLPALSFGHALGCACCTPRHPAANALAELFRARATGSAPFFKAVIVAASPAGLAAVRDAIARDVVASARFSFQPDRFPPKA